TRKGGAGRERDGRQARRGEEPEDDFQLSEEVQAGMAADVEEPRETEQAGEGTAAGDNYLAEQSRLKESEERKERERAARLREEAARQEAVRRQQLKEKVERQLKERLPAPQRADGDSLLVRWQKPLVGVAAVLVVSLLGYWAWQLYRPYRRVAPPLQANVVWEEYKANPQLANQKYANKRFWVAGKLVLKQAG